MRQIISVQTANFKKGRNPIVPTSFYLFYFSDCYNDQTATPKSRNASFNDVFLSVDSFRWPIIKAAGT